ncbi:mediator of RNA polymerase II transcription subunit 12-like [Phymastichus coffea]|uniref:mediator of RNA polymerase II transcription subunit 12-like n=1 Tax=Phymastichus coffea TaxID=108790 RepID=UPI00273BD406|nr:mediator of RNA polymerase II transcription subunit 12-like [Phymastichus coffea]
MFALVVVTTLVSQSLAAPSNCGTASVCDSYSGRQTLPGSSQTKGGYSSYSKWGSSSSWSSGPLVGGTSSPSANLETFDDGNLIGTGGLNRPGSWRDEKSYVTDDRKGKIDYKASQEITGNSYRKSAESSYSWGTHDYNEPKANSQFIHSSQFDGQIRDVERDMEAFIGQFSFGAGSTVNQQTLESFRRQADQLSRQVTGLCDQADVNSEQYRQLQRIKQNFDRQVQLKQQEIMNFAVESKHSISGSIGSSSVGASYEQPQPHYSTVPVYPEPIYQAPVTANPVEIQRERVQQECNKLRANIDSFYNNFVTADYSTYDREDTLTTFRAQVNAQVATINQQIANLRVESANFEYQRNFVEEMNRTFESYVTNLNQHIKDCEDRIRAEQLRLIKEQERIQKEKLERERLEADRRYQENLLKIQEQHDREQREFEERQRLEVERLEKKKIEAELEWERKKEKAERVTYQPRPQPSLPQVQLPVQTVAPNVEVAQNGGWSHKVDVHISGSQHHEVSGSGVGGASSGQQIQYQPVQIGPHIDFTEIQNKMSQEFNRLVSSVNRLSSYSMQLTESNQQTINAQFQRDANELRRKIENLCQESSQYHNDHVFKAAEDLKRTLEQSFQYFQQELAKVSSSGSFQDSSSWNTGSRYTNVRQPHISNVEINHSKSTEFELSHGGRGNAGQQQVVCVEQYANQPCIEPVRVRRDAGGYYSQQHEFNLGEYTPRQRRNQRRRYEFETEDYSQQHVDPQIELSDYSQRMTHTELPRNRQESTRSDSYRKRDDTQNQNSQLDELTRQENTDHHSQRSHYSPYSSRYGQRETEDLSQQYVQSGQNEDLQLYQKPRNGRAQDESQQYVQSGKNEDLQSYQKPQRERIQVTPKSERLEDFSEESLYVDNRQRGSLQKTQQIEAANLEREQSSASTGRTLLDQRLVVDEPQDIVKPIIKPGKLGSTRDVNDYSLENSGFYDNPKSQENSKLNDNLQQSYQRPSQTQTIETHGKLSDETQKPRGSSISQLTLENSGFDDYRKQNEQYAITESPTEQVTTFKNLVGSQQSENLTLQKSGFFENPGQDPNLEMMESSESTRNKDFVQNDDRQQSLVGMNFGSEIQLGRRSNLRPERINSHIGDTQQNLMVPALSTENSKYSQREHPMEQYIHNLPQQNRPPSPNIIDLEPDEPNSQFVNNNSQDKVLSSEDQQSLVTAYPPVKPAPKPIPRYTRPWQVSQNRNEPHKSENEYSKQSGNQNTVLKSSSSQNSNESNKPHGLYRGDLPGHSESTAEQPVYIPPQSTPVPNVKLNTTAPITETPGQPVEPEVLTQKTPCITDRCQDNQFDELSQTYYYRQQHQQNIRFSQQSIHSNQQNLEMLGHQHQNPFYQQNSQVQFDKQMNPVNYAPKNGYTFRYRDQQTNHLSINHQGSTHSFATEPTSLEQRDLLGLNEQESLHQQVQNPSLGNSSGQKEFSQHHSTFTYNQHSNYSPDDGFPARVIPLGKTQSKDIWADIESTTRPTFWNRVGHKISNAYDKVKESARIVYG